MASTLGWGELPKQNPRMEPRVFSLASFPFSCLASWIYPHRTTQGTQGTPAPLALIDVPLVALAGDLLMATRPNATLPGFPSSARAPTHPRTHRLHARTSREDTRSPRARSQQVNGRSLLVRCPVATNPRWERDESRLDTHNGMH